MKLFDFQSEVTAGTPSPERLGSSYVCRNCGCRRYRRDKKPSGWGTHYWCPKCTVQFADPKTWSSNGGR